MEAECFGAMTYDFSLYRKEKNMNLPYKDTHDPLIHRDAKFIGVLHYTSVGMLLQMDKAHLRHSLARARLICRWLEDILEPITGLEIEGNNHGAPYYFC
jgi:hypothetical protein